MPTDFYAFEMLTGRRLTPLPVSRGDWKLTTNADETLSCTVSARAAVTAKLKIWDTTTLARNGLLVVVDDVPVAAGPLWKRSYTQGGDLSFTAGGLRSYWDRRLLLPVAARTKPLVNAAGDPDTTLDTTVTGVSYGTIIKRWVELARLWPGGNIPMLLPADEVGTREKTVAAVDLKTIRKLIDDIQGLEEGPDLAFVPRWAEDGLGIYWEMQVGTNAKPRLGNTDASLVKWTVGAPVGGAFNLKVDEDATGMTQEVFALGGSSADKIIAARGYNPKLDSEGYPLMQSSDTDHGTVVKQDTMQSYANQGAYLGQFSASFWSMSARAKEKGSPRLGDFWLGDMATVTVDKREPILPPGDYPRRIASIAGNQDSSQYDLVFAEAVA